MHGTRSCRWIPPMAVVLMAARPAAADWGDAWGQMLWSAPPPIPALGGLGALLLAATLATFALRALRTRSGRLLTIALVSLLALPTVGLVSLPHVFLHDTAANANEMNANFGALATVLGVSVPHTFVNGQVADANKVNENFSTLEAGSNTLEAELLQCQLDLCVEELKVCFEVSDLSEIFVFPPADIGTCQAFCGSAVACTHAERTSRCAVSFLGAQSCD